MYGYIYLTTNLLNNKKYIGKHKKNIFDINYKGSGKILLQAIEKDGWDNFKCELLHECFSEEDLNTQEAYYIKQYKAVESNSFYNLKPGGLGKSEKGKIFIHDDVQQFKIYPSELDIYIRQGYTKGRFPRSPDAIKITTLKNKGKKRTAETRLKQRIAQLGKKVSLETREKLSKVHQGKSTSRKGKITMYNPVADKQIYVDKSDLEYFLNLGYKRGCKPRSKDFGKHISAGKKGTIIINNGKYQKYIKPQDFNHYKFQGFIKGKLISKL